MPKINLKGPPDNSLDLPKFIAKIKMCETFLTEVLELYGENDWKGVLKLSQKAEDADSRKLLWAWPSESNLRFVKNVLDKYKCEGIVSIGCGCGLLEWILKKYCGLPVVGYEVNKEWWASKYSNPQFITLSFPNLPPSEDILDPNFALLFCYFNNGPAFNEYVDCYNGNVIFIIGPGRGAGRHTDPQPFNPNFSNDNTHWTLHAFDEVRNTKDFIAVYVRNNTVQNAAEL